MNQTINKEVNQEIINAILKLPKRAENSEREKLVQTFVDIGPLFSLLTNIDHQILYGRRGTGKTHVLNYLAEKKENENDVVIYIDLRNIGSSSGLYADGTIPLSERATRLLVDTFHAIHTSLTEYFIKNSLKFDLLDNLSEAITQVKVTGNVKEVLSKSNTKKEEETTQWGFVASPSSPRAEMRFTNSSNSNSNNSQIKSTDGTEQLYVNFGSTSVTFKEIISSLNKKRLWILIDEWSSIPVELQPYLADLIRRSLFPIRGISVKIAAIEHRTEFMIQKDKGNYTGIEVGADASADVNLDDFMVFDNDAEKSQDFFQNLLIQHINALIDDSKQQELLSSENSIIQKTFTEKRAFEEYVRSCEGIPRDAINLISLAAQKAVSSAISVQNIRDAANNWYQRDKEKVVSSNSKAQQLLHWIVDNVIGKRQARAFLLRSNTSDPLIDNLYDSRVIHILKKGISSNDEPGIRYDVYKLDYGCYVDLLNTVKAPQGLLPFGDENDYELGESPPFTEVPPDDYRTIRRAILDLQLFYNSKK